MQPMMDNWAGSKGEWIEEILWKRKDVFDRSMLVYQGMPIYVGNYPAPKLFIYIFIEYSIYHISSIHSTNGLDSHSEERLFLPFSLLIPHR